MPEQTHADRRAKGLEALASIHDIGAAAAAAMAEEMEGSRGALGSFALDTCLGELWTRPGISRRDRSLIVIAMLTALNQLIQLRIHVSAGLNHGLREEEIEELMVHVAGYAGFPRAIDGMNTVRDVLRERAGGAEPPPRAPAERKSDDERRRDMQQVREGMFAGVPTAGAGRDLGPIAGFAREWLFGEVWPRPQLPRRDRSLITVSALTALGRVDELALHIPGAFNNGVSVEEVEELIATAAFYVGFPFAVEAMVALRDAQGESRKGSAGREALEGRVRHAAEDLEARARVGAGEVEKRTARAREVAERGVRTALAEAQKQAARVRERRQHRDDGDSGDGNSP